MSQKLLVTVVGALLLLTASLGAGCASDPSTASSERGPTDGISAEEALTNSRAAFAEVDSLLIRNSTEIDGLRLYEGEIGITDRRVLYSRLVYIGEVLSEAQFIIGFTSRRFE